MPAAKTLTTIFSPAFHAGFCLLGALPDTPPATPYAIRTTQYEIRLSLPILLRMFRTQPQIVSLRRQYLLQPTPLMSCIFLIEQRPQSPPFGRTQAPPLEPIPRFINPTTIPSFRPSQASGEICQNTQYPSFSHPRHPATERKIRPSVHIRPSKSFGWPRQNHLYCFDR